MDDFRNRSAIYEINDVLLLPNMWDSLIIHGEQIGVGSASDHIREILNFARRPYPKPPLNPNRMGESDH